jgi:hypothetical protein
MLVRAGSRSNTSMLTQRILLPVPSNFSRLSAFAALPCLSALAILRLSIHNPLDHQITHLFSCPNIPTSSNPSAPRPALAHFIAYSLYRTQLPSQVTTAALLLLSRLKARYPAARGSSGHRLFIAAFMSESRRSPQPARAGALGDNRLDS